MELFELLAAVAADLENVRVTYALADDLEELRRAGLE